MASKKNARYKDNRTLCIASGYKDQAFKGGVRVERFASHPNTSQGRQMALEYEGLRRRSKHGFSPSIAIKADMAAPALAARVKAARTEAPKGE